MPVRVTFQLLDYDHKRMHYFEQLFHTAEGWVSATSENISLHVDMGAKRTAPFPDPILAALGRVDVLVNNAGISQPKGLLEISEAEFDHTIAVNMKGQFNWCKALAPAMLTLPEARIVNISSVSAHTGAGFSAVSRFAYCTSKAGVLGLTRGQALRLIVLPQAARTAIAPLSNSFISMVKDTSLAATIQVPELFRQAQLITARTLQIFTMYLAVAAIYWAACSLLALVQTRLERARDNQTAALYNYNVARIDLAQSVGAVRRMVE